MKRRGSAMVFVIIVVFSITSVVLVAAKLSSASETEYVNNLQDAQFDAMADGSLSQLKADAYKNAVSVGTRSNTFDKGTVTTAVAAHPTLPRAYLLTMTGRIGDRDFRRVKVVGNRVRPNPSFYGLWVGGTYSDSALATRVDGSAYFAANATISGPWTVTKDYLNGGAATLNVGTTVGGHYLTGVRAQTMTPSSAANYTGGTSLGNTATNLTFGPESGGYYAIFNKGTGNLTLSGGTISGKGTVYVAGNLTISGNYNYADANSRVVFIVKGRLTVNATATQIVGTYLVENRIDLSGVTLTVPRGNLCTSGTINRLLCALDITQDMAFLDSQAECTKHKIPGF